MGIGAQWVRYCDIYWDDHFQFYHTKEEIR